MAKQNLLLVDHDTQHLRVMEVSLRKAGYSVTTARNGSEALTKIGGSLPDLVISDTAMPDLDGFELCSRLKSDMQLRDIPFLFLTRDNAVESKVRGLQLGAEDYLIRPIYTRELIARVAMILGRREQEALKRPEARRRFFGDLANMGVVDLIQAMEVGRKNGTLRIEGAGLDGTMWFIDGQLVDSNAGSLQGEEAVYRMLSWDRGRFEVDFRTPERLPAISQTTQAVLMEGMRRIDEWARITEQLPPLDSVMQVDYNELATRLGELPDDVNALLRLFDGRRSILQVIDSAGRPDIETVTGVSRLYFEGILYRMPEGAEPEENAERAAVLAEIARSTAPPPVRNLGDELLESVSAEPSAQAPEAPVAPAPDLSRPPPPPPEAFSQGPPQVDAPTPAPATPATDDPSLWDLTAAVREKGDEASSASTISLEMALLNEEDDVFPEFEQAKSTGERDEAEDDFFATGVNLGQVSSETPFVFDDDLDAEDGGAQKITIGLALVVVLGGLSYLVLNDQVTPQDVPKNALHSNWHTTKLKEGAAAKPAAVLDAGWRIPSEPDGGVAPPPEAVRPEDKDSAEAVAVETANGSEQANTIVEAPEVSPEDAKKAGTLTAEGLKQYSQGNFEAAVMRFEQALSIAPGAKSALVGYTKGLIEVGRLDDALETAEKAVRIDNENADAYLVLGAARQEKELPTKAISAYERYLKLDPKSPHAVDIREVIKGLRANSGR